MFYLGNVLSCEKCNVLVCFLICLLKGYEWWFFCGFEYYCSVFCCGEKSVLFDCFVNC